MRAWNREVRKLALEFAPELFHYIPDLLTPGGVMGDGGFASIAGIQRRSVEDYESVRPFSIDVKNLNQAGGVNGNGNKGKKEERERERGGESPYRAGARRSGESLSRPSACRVLHRATYRDPLRDLAAVKASGQPEEVVLKMFVMQDPMQVSLCLSLS